MILELQSISPKGTLNNFEVIGASQFVNGYAAEFVFRLIQKGGLRYIPDQGVTFSLELTTSDGTILQKTPTLKFADDDRSILTVSLTAQETENLISQSITIDVIEGQTITPAFKQMAVQSVRASGC